LIRNLQPTPAENSCEAPVASRRTQVHLHTAEIEREFIQTAVDLKTVVVLDGVDVIPGRRGFRIRSHDLFGSLPTITVIERADSQATRRNLRHEACKVMAIVHIRGELSRLLPGLKFQSGESAAGDDRPELELEPNEMAADVDALLAGYRSLRKQAGG
jgi:hypothetical protein